MEGRRRRPGRLLAGFVAVAIGVGVAVAASQGGPRDTATRLHQRLEAANDPRQFAFSYQRGGTRVLDCLSANRRFDVEVDLEQSTMVVAAEHDSPPFAIREHETVLLARTLFADPPFAASWLAAPAATQPPSTVTRVVGTDATGYLFTPSLPASGQALAHAAVDAAASVTELGTADINGARVTTFRVTVDAAKYAAAAERADDQKPQARDDAGLLPRFDIAIDDSSGAVLRITVAPQRADGTMGPAEDGWTLQYHPPGRVARPGEEDRIDLIVVDAADLLAPRRDCSLGP